MLLDTLIHDLKTISKNFDENLIEREITSISYDLRNVKPNSLFICIKGSKFDTHNFIQDAFSNGALFIIGEKKLDIKNYIQVENSRKALAVISAIFFGNPSKKLKIIAVTGTKGKTTSAHLIASSLNAANLKCAVIGTLGITLVDRILKTENTTPDSYQVNYYLSLLVSENYKYVVIEASSIGLRDWRLYGINFFISIFTNFSTDHISQIEHKSLEEYFNSKLILFETSDNIFINYDDEKSKYIEKIYKEKNKKIIKFGIKSGDIRASDIKYTIDKNRLGTEFKLNENSGIEFNFKNEKFKINILGKFNIYNALSLICVCGKIGIKIEIIRKILLEFEIKGRSETIFFQKGFFVIIDYAHNESSMENFLISLKKYNPNRIITMFGAGGGRSKERRFGMGEISGKYSDLSILTEDNSRNENVFDIIKDIEIGIKRSKGVYKIIPDRTEAIKFCLNIAQKGDIIVLAGKGHETYQEINDVKYHFDEREIINRIMNIC